MQGEIRTKVPTGTPYATVDFLQKSSILTLCTIRCALGEH